VQTKRCTPSSHTKGSYVGCGTRIIFWEISGT
jgi:hypothetical protein